jgi:ABC-type uncharacterized transport system substrate-binding protein
MKILNGVLALLIAAGILLFSDLENRIEKTEKADISSQAVASTQAVASPQAVDSSQAVSLSQTPQSSAGEAVNDTGSLAQKKPASDQMIPQDKPTVPKKKQKLCFIHYVDSPNSENVEAGVRSELKKQGMTEGKDFSMKVFNAQGDMSTLNSIAETVSGDKWDLIFSSSTQTIQLLSKKITNTPIVFSNVGDPVRAGLGESFEKHLPTITGISTMSDFNGLVKMVVESMPGIKKIGTIFTPGEINSVVYMEELKKAAEKKGLELIAVPANSPTEVADASLSIVNRGIEAFTQISDNLTASSGSSIIKASYDAGIPYFGFITEQVASGAVAALAKDYFYAGVDAAKMAKQIFDGKSPADIPFQYVSKTSVTINQEAMIKYGIKIPKKYFKK